MILVAHPHYFIQKGSNGFYIFIHFSQEIARFLKEYRFLKLLVSLNQVVSQSDVKLMASMATQHLFIASHAASANICSSLSLIATK